MRLSAANPFLIELERRKCKTSTMLADLGLPTDVPASPDLFVALPTMYSLVEQCAEISGDSHFGFKVGSAIDVRRWDPFRDAAAEAATVGDLLLGFVMKSAEHSATRFFLDVGSERATFRMQRPLEPKVRPSQNDAFYAGMISRLLESSAPGFNPDEVLARVSDPTAVPKTGSIGRIAEEDKRGVSVSFPSRWLREPFRLQSLSSETIRAAAMPDNIFENLWIALSPHIGDDRLSAEKAAGLCGFTRRRLSGLLRKRGTTIAKEIASMRARVAIDRLLESNDPVADIGLKVGYPDPAVFARAFKSWTGKSPTEYRREHKPQD